MKIETFKLLLATIENEKSISITALSESIDETKRRIYTVLPLIEHLGLITRKTKGIIDWVIMDPEDNSMGFQMRRIKVSAKGVITGVKQYGPQSVVIDQTAIGFVVEDFDE